MKFIPLYVLSVLFLTPGNGINQNHYHKSIGEISPAPSRNILEIHSQGLFRDTLLIPDDTVPKVVIPAGTIQVATKDLQGLKSRIKTLRCGSYNQPFDGGRKNAKLKWKGLFEAKNRFYIADTKLRLKPWHSEVDNEPNEKTGWSVSCDNKNENIILINGDAHLVNGTVKKALPPTELYYAGQKIEFMYNGTLYTLYTTGFKRDGKIFNYKLFLLAKVKGYYFNQLLRSLPVDESLGAGGEMAQREDIEFVGDLDGDKIPDFIITGSGFPYGYTELYLSRPAGRNSILKSVSVYGDSD